MVGPHMEAKNGKGQPDGPGVAGAQEFRSQDSGFAGAAGAQESRTQELQELRILLQTQKRIANSGTFSPIQAAYLDFLAGPQAYLLQLLNS
jgi:hypothetical protein